MVSLHVAGSGLQADLPRLPAALIRLLANADPQLSAVVPFADRRLGTPLPLLWVLLELAIQ